MTTSSKRGKETGVWEETMIKRRTTATRREKLVWLIGSRFTLLRMKVWDLSEFIFYLSSSFHPLTCQLGFKMQGCCIKVFRNEIKKKGINNHKMTEILKSKDHKLKLYKDNKLYLHIFELHCVLTANTRRLIKRKLQRYEIKAYQTSSNVNEWNVDVGKKKSRSQAWPLPRANHGMWVISPSFKRRREARWRVKVCSLTS